jgi:hypothetical protein
MQLGFLFFATGMIGGQDSNFSVCLFTLYYTGMFLGFYLIVAFALQSWTIQKESLDGTPIE